MADLSSIQKLKLEKIFITSPGYVLDFTNRTFQEFVLENTGIDIYDEKYNYESGSKANRLRAFWAKESNYLTGKLLKALLDMWDFKTASTDKQKDRPIYEECLKIAQRLLQNTPIEHIDAIESKLQDESFSSLAKSIKDSIQKNEPEVALDRLHTLLVKFIRKLCEKHQIVFDKNKPLHSLLGEYIKKLKSNGVIESYMTERILKSSISVFEAFNSVRNEQSFAHDNPILNYNESVLIFNYVLSTIKFIESIEKDKSEIEDAVNLEYKEMPF